MELDAPNIGECERQRVNQAFEAGYISTFGPFVTEFEDKFSAYVKTKSSVAIQSGTAALHMALHELKIGAGDEVIVHALTFAATIHAVLYVGATPVIVDVEKDTWNISTDAIKRAITKKTKAILPVHLYGNPCKMDVINDIAKKNNLFVIEDAAESLGAIYQGTHTGLFGDYGCFSFNGNKIITTGGGGMITAKEENRLKHVRYLINQANPGFGFDGHAELGFNYRMTNIMASLGLAQLDRVEDFIYKKESFFNIYQEQLGEVSGVEFQKEYANAKSSKWFTSILLPEGILPVEVIEKLKEHNIPSRRIFEPLNQFDFCADCANGKLENANEIYARGICLPSSTLNEDKDILKVCLSLKEIFS